MLQLSAIKPGTLDILISLQQQAELVDTRLVGGTALALQLGHRLSVDIDLLGIWDQSVDMTEIDDIAAMKLEAINNRGSKKGFIDIAFLLERHSIEEILALYHAKYPRGSEYLVLRSLVYFDDAEDDPMPVMLKPITWEVVKARIMREVRRYSLRR